MPPEPPQPTDEQLLHRFTRGDRAALGQLAARYENPLVGLATGLLGGRADLAHDAVQESWVRVIKYAKSFAGQSSFKTWMFRIVINNCRDMRNSPPSPALAGDRALGSEAHESRKSGGTRSVSNSMASARADEGVSQARSEQSGTPFRLVTTEVSEDEVAAAINTLPQNTRLILLLCYHRGLTHPQAADVLGIPIGTLKSRLSAGLAELRADLQRARTQLNTATAKAAT